MEFDLAIDIKNAILTAVKNGIDAAAPQKGKFKIYTAPKPTPGAPITTQVLLAECQCSYPCASVADGVFIFSAISEEDLGLATGIAAFTRLVDGVGTYVADGDVGDMNSDAFVKLNSTNIFQGGIVRINVGILTI